MIMQQAKKIINIIFCTILLTSVTFVSSSFANEKKEQTAIQKIQNQEEKELLPKEIPTEKETNFFEKKETPPPPTFSWTSYFEAIGIMLILLFAFWYLLKIVRKVGNGRFLPSQKLLPRDSMFLEGQLSLGQGKSIIIVKVLNERLILGVTEHQITMLTKAGINNVSTFEELLQETPSQDTTNN